MSPCLTLSNLPSWASEMQSKQYSDICDAKWGPPLLSWLIWPVPVLFGRIVKTLLGMLFLVTKGLEDDWCAPMPHISPSYPKILTPWNYQCCPKATNSLWTSLSLVHHNQEASEHTPTVQGSFTSNLLIPAGSHTPCTRCTSNGFHSSPSNSSSSPSKTCYHTGMLPQGIPTCKSQGPLSLS